MSYLNRGRSQFTGVTDLDSPVDLFLDGVLPPHVPDLLNRIHESAARLADRD